MPAVPRKCKLPFSEHLLCISLLPTFFAFVPHRPGREVLVTPRVAQLHLVPRPGASVALALHCPAFPPQSQLPLRCTHRTHRSSCPWGGRGSRPVKVGSAQGPAHSRKQSGADSQRLGSPGPLPRPSSSLASLTYFPFPFRERVQQSQERGKVSVVAFLI